MTSPTPDLGHKTRFSDSSLYDEVCTLCGATDGAGDKRLNAPCPAAMSAPTPEITNRDLSDMLRRVRAAKGPDYFIDRAICGVLYKGVAWRDPTKYFVEIPRLTSSVDAVLALIAERLPGWGYRLDTTATAPELTRLGIGQSSVGAVLFAMDGRKHIETSPTPALALLAAALEAISAMEQQE